MELRDYLNVLRARKWTILQAVVIATLAMLTFSLLQRPLYQGEAKVLITDKDVGTAILGTAIGELGGTPERGLQTQVQLMRLRPLAEITIRRLSLQTTPEELLERVSVSAAGQTNVISISVEDTDPKRAADTANALAEAYVDWSKQAKRESIKAAADEVQRRLDEAKTEILALGRKINAKENVKVKPGIQKPTTADWTAELQIATGLYASMADKLEQLRVNEQLETGSGRVVQSAAVDDEPISPRTARNTGLALAFGLVLGIGLAFVMEYLDNTIKSTEEAERIFGAPVLGHIPQERFEKGELRRLSIVQHPGSSAAEAYRVVRNSLEFVNFEHDLQALLVTSAAPSEGKSTVSANLAMALAQAGAKVVLLNCDFRRPTTEQFFSVNNSVGLSDVLLGRNSLKSALQRPIAGVDLLVLTAGKMPPNPSELLGSSKMSELVASLKEWSDWVIVDSPPLLAVADAAAAARWADGVLLVTRGGVSSRDAAKNGREMLDKVGARIIGVVIWGLDESGASQGYSYRYGGYYQQYYGVGTPEAPRKRSKKSASGCGPAAARASAEESAQEPDGFRSGKRESFRMLSRLLPGILSFLVVLAVGMLVLYALDLYLGWGLMAAVGNLL